MKKLKKLTGVILCAALMLSMLVVGIVSVSAGADTTGPQTPYALRFSTNGDEPNFWYNFAADADLPTLKLGDVYRFSYYYSVPEGSSFPDNHGAGGAAYFSFKIGGRIGDTGNDWLKLDSFQSTYTTDGQWKYEEYTWTVPADYASGDNNKVQIQRFRVNISNTFNGDYLKLTDIRLAKVTNGVAGENILGSICQNATFSTSGIGSWARSSYIADNMNGKSAWWASDYKWSFLIQETNLDEFKRPVTTCDVKDSEGNTLATVNAGDALDLSTLTLPVRDGYWFAGYYTDAACTQPFATGTAISEDTTLYYGWVDSADFDILGVQVRLTEPNGLRFMCRAKTSMLEQLEALNAQENSMSFGMLLQPENKMGNAAFTREDATTSKYLVDRNADNYAQKDEHTYFNAVVIDIPETRYAATVVLRSYVTYLDASGIERTYYNASYSSATLTDSPYAVASLATAAQATLDADAAETDTAKKLSDAAKARLEEIISKSSNA